ncbi:N-acetyl-gamma-glutamyl-phosphate reductase [Desulfurispirillum indicum]|uniref:N-acetyl-gamma-glutamyl-phosphate reductase n=1 Tax=Desulfurispirillum indicum TaxID=936456 RepID=UPI001CF9A8A7|nr:N-acetyl-gamma-glutamyl-phosphate reductase [Desulfurispirillum indicum]UCZ57628.1 N-acetyl-gamma-glutamyl-phosphate reductase [Desulfurispirillum indicum]
MIRAAIIGATGYTGAELMRILLLHPEATLEVATSQSSCTERVTDHYPALHGLCDLRFEENIPESIARRIDVVFLALPHGEAMEAAIAYHQLGVRVIDLSADFRIDDAGAYRNIYGKDHLAPQLLRQKVYGLSEINRTAIAASSLVANPGCYPTCTLLSVAPLAQKGLLCNPVIVDAKSGVSGAGKKPGPRTHFVEINEGFSPYGVGTHRHQPEITQEMDKLGTLQSDVIFTPHLLPLSRGMLTTTYLGLQPGTTVEQVVTAYEQFCQHKPFVYFLGLDRFPSVRDVRGSNNCFIGIHIDIAHQRAIVIAAIDNLMKGASGQAVQNMNIMFGLPEDCGLKGMLQVL